MASHLEVTVETDERLPNAAVKDALRDAEKDFSATSPVDSHRDVVTAHHVEEVEGDEEGETHTEATLVVSAEGDGEFTRQTEDAIVDAIKAIDGVDRDNVTIEGGYEAADDGDDGDGDSDEE